jgi:predicted AlkP superfamily phosphohydrolase/phosphomutase
MVLGLDGATFDLLLPRVDQGQMPNLAALLRDGVWGGLRSTTPPFSAQAWVSMVTGKNPGKHGVVDFWEKSSGQAPDQRRSFVSARQIHGETLWQIAGRHGLRVGVVNVPVTYPPTAVNGYLVSGLLTPQGRDDYAYPPELAKAILDQVPGYNPDPFDPLGTSRQQISALQEWMEKHEVISRYLMDREPTDLFFNVVQALDHLQHLFWNDIAAGSQRADGLAPDRCYRLADDIIGHRLGLVDERTNLFLVSDHGFGPVRKWFHVNRFLLERGFLTLGEPARGAAAAASARLGLTPQRIRSLVRRVDRLGLRQRIGRLARVTLGRRIDSALALPVDWSRTRAYSGSPATEGIFINLKGREAGGIVLPGRHYEQVRDELAAALQALRDPETHAPVVQSVFRREELYAGPFLDLLPDLVFDLGDGPYLAGDALDAERMLEALPAGFVQGRHRSTGILAAIGPDIRSAGQMPVEGARIVDVAPTLLFALGLPIPEDMDGLPLLELFTEDYRSSHPLRYTAPESAAAMAPGPGDDEEDTAEMERRLRGLGYVG